MARRVFYSFHYQNDSHRVQRIMQMGSIEGQPFLGHQQWEDVAAGGDPAIQRWIDSEMKGKSCNVVLIGQLTAGRRWVNYEIIKAWNDGKGVVGVYIHGLQDLNLHQNPKGQNPFTGITVKGTTPMSSIVKAYDPGYRQSADNYNFIRTNLPTWVDEAIEIRKKW